MNDLETILEPLLEVLNRRYRTSANEEFLIPLLGQIGAPDVTSDEISLELPDGVDKNPDAIKAIVALVRRAGSSNKWGCGAQRYMEPEAPLRLSLTKRSGWAGYFWQVGRYLVFDHHGEELDFEAAAKQVRDMADLLENPTTLPDVSQEEFAFI